MSNEMREWLAEREAYEREVYEDFVEQSAETVIRDGESIYIGTTTPEYISFLLRRMYSEGLPSKENQGN